jgi:FkbM family methyltransferase
VFKERIIRFILRFPLFVWLTLPAEGRQLRRLRYQTIFLKDRQDHTLKVNNWTLRFPDRESFLLMYHSIFVNKIYAFRASTPQPNILDLGANIGLSVLFFKQIYPEAQITAYEPDPTIFDYLKKNVHGNGYTDVNLRPKAVWIEKTTLSFYTEGTWAGHIAEQGEKDHLLEVETDSIADLLQEHSYDFVKIDIEGAETALFPYCKPYLHKIKYLFIEYHQKHEDKSQLHCLLADLHEAGFKTHIHTEVSSPSPFMAITSKMGFELQLAIFAWRD